MKVITVLGTRPEIIRLSTIIPLLDQYVSHILVHTGQNYDVNLNDIFFEQLGVRPPDYALGATGSIGHQLGTIFSKIEEVILREKPDKLLVLGDTNSALSAVIASRYGIPVYHMEAGNRCFDDRVPEEVNRRIVDHSSEILMPYTERSRTNLLNEGIPSQRIFVTGNPIYEVIQNYRTRIDQADIHARLNLVQKKYFLVTLHRAENVDNEERLQNFTKALEEINIKYGMPIIVSTHPRPKSKLIQFGISPDSEKVQFLPPFGFFDFLKLEEQAYCMLSDSGTVQEECAILRVPNVTLRDVTERPETLECGSNILSGAAQEDILRAIDIVTNTPNTWFIPPEYLVENVSNTILKILTGYYYKL